MRTLSQCPSLNRFRTNRGHCGSCRNKCSLAATDMCPCDKCQTMSHIVNSCPQSKLERAAAIALSWWCCYWMTEDIQLVNALDNKYYDVFIHCSFKTLLNVKENYKLECGPMPNLMVALPNIGGALCSTPQSLCQSMVNIQSLTAEIRRGKKERKRRKKKETGWKYNGLPYYIGRP